MQATCGPRLSLCKASPTAPWLPYWHLEM
jgi:hypothetical protein